MLFFHLEVMAFVVNIWKTLNSLSSGMESKPQKEVKLNGSGVIYLWASQPGLVISKLLKRWEILTYQTGSNSDYSDRDWAESFLLLINTINQIVVGMLKILKRTKASLYNIEPLREIDLHYFIWSHLFINMWSLKTCWLGEWMSWIIFSN